MPLTWDSSTDSATTWTVWVMNDSSTSATTEGVWGNWTSGTNYTVTNVWVSWAGTTNGNYPVTAPYTPPLPETEEQRAAREERARLHREQQQAREAECLVAQERAEQLLRDQLTIEQVAQLVQGNYFDVISESGKRYRVQRGRSKNVALLDGERITKRYCIHHDYDVPSPDVMLTQKLMLETMERDFLRIANVHPADAAFA
jgi:hypothetical protein